MAFSSIEIFLLLLLLITPLDISLAKKRCVIQTRYEVHVINKLPANTAQLELHCASKNDDLGYHYPAINEDFNWEFCEFIITLYFCHFWWGSKDKSFDVYDDPSYCVKNGKNPNLLKCCKWEVRDDGFYLEQYDASTSTYYMERLEQW
ncbi:hypothetical protein MTR67_041559 [Solanum verrucosum]|uniref:S-protein homolog n=1 Tax=Solanum verrucosum TaxID=315347 RepID=A0AAF0ULP0_SOLVR|nr:hypothetical protein MTR67_041559 [Solanum verrucosum]